MPSIPKYTKCSVLGCKNTKSKYNSYCLQHGGRDTFKYDRTAKDPNYIQAQKKYHSTQWQTLRQVQLSIEPLCAGCLSSGIVTQAQHVDHVFPWQQIGEVAFYHNVFQSLCQSCHSSKTKLEQKGIFRRYGKKNIDYSVIDYKRVCGM